MSTQTQTAASSKSTGTPKTIIWSGLAAGILDGLAAMIVFHIWFKLTPGQVMQFIASGVFGPSSFTGGTNMVFAGIFFHFVIAYIFAAFYYFVFPKLSFLRTKPVIAGLIYGFGIWLVMNMLVIPLSQIQPSPFNAGLAAVSVVWHMVLVGLPIAVITKKFFNRPDSNTK